MTYEELEQAAVGWAQGQGLIRAVLAIGSRARREHPADEWSDLDLILLTTDARPFNNNEWLAALGPVWAAVVEEANPGDPDVQAIFEGGVKGDFTFATVRDEGRPLDELLDEMAYQGVLGRGGRVLFDRYGEPRVLAARPLAAPPAPTEAEYRELIDAFWLYAARVAKFTRRGDLWRAITNLFAEVNMRLLTLIEWHAQAGGAQDTWYDGRFMADWADRRALEALAGVFPRYDGAESRLALLGAVDLFRLLARETAARRGYVYPVELDNRISTMIAECFDGAH